MKRIDPNELDIKQSEIICFSCVRNEILRLPFFLDYHRNLGVDRFIFVDNASSDGTTEFLCAQTDTNVYFTDESYASSNCGIDWLNQLISELGVDHWILTMDADEMLVYPDCEQVTLKQLTEYLESEGTQAIQTFLIDMYSDKPIKDTHYVSGQSFLDCASYFDTDSYFAINKDGIPTRGGPRHRLFWEKYDREKNSPYLINVPLIKWRKELSYKTGTHVISNLKVSELIGGKLHFKFFSDFYDYVESEAQRNEHWDDAAQYKTYWDVIKDNNELSGWYEGSEKYRDSIQLVDLGLINRPKRYFKFVHGRNVSKNGLFSTIRKIFKS